MCRKCWFLFHHIHVSNSIGNFVYEEFYFYLWKKNWQNVANFWICIKLLYAYFYVHSNCWFHFISNFSFFILCGCINLMYFQRNVRSFVLSALYSCIRVIFYCFFMWFSMKPTNFMRILDRWFKKGCQSVSIAYRKALMTVWPPSHSSISGWIPFIHSLLSKRFDHFEGALLFPTISCILWMYSLVTAQ